MRILVAGGAGYVGARLVAALRAAGHETAVLGRKPRSELLSAYVEYSGDARRLLQFFDTWRPEAVVYLAADLSKSADISGVTSLITSNVLLPTHIAAACAQSGVKRLVNISTYSTMMEPPRYSPQTLYAATKRACEDILTYFNMSEGVGVCTLAFYDIYGPSQPHTRFINSAVASVLGGAEFRMTRGEQDICLLNVRDAVSAVIHAVESPSIYSASEPVAFAVYGDEVFKVSDLPDMIAAIAGVQSIAVKRDLPYRKNEIMAFRPPYPRLPGWTPRVSFSAGIVEIISELKIENS